MEEQHRCEQERIDKLIELENASKEFRYEETAQYGFDLFWKSVNE